MVVNFRRGSWFIERMLGDLFLGISRGSSCRFGGLCWALVPVLDNPMRRYGVGTSLFRARLPMMYYALALSDGHYATPSWDFVVAAAPLRV